MLHTTQREDQEINEAGKGHVDNLIAIINRLDNELEAAKQRVEELESGT